ncbi:TIGR03960 family B12-binding radical SAM protein [Parasporobacterium paucivorans]|uniref:Radical SAM family uncharacterized protein n=1 Tax=Parasporobacterium paucivorans DSM 15970 TaxID=1122934 RepID=A0A1M6A6K5_9FIRM|nr:TIGR03960 family B12-binding radical SAM protein [Parasporobacterium paucivorans]SHI31793.1 radical SAM family uncharacterized protein [Parasporobacterium paucivorans DSM 15970]
MKKLALPEDILLRVEKPGRYIGNEFNTVLKNPEEVEIRFAMCFPDIYEIGMSHLGIQILYDMFNQREDVYCERVYSPWTDLDRLMRQNNIPLFALESQDPIKDFDFLGITIQYEMCYTNILQVLELSGIPLLSSERNEDDPIVIGGGPCTYNPEPLADFFDLFYIGEGETSYFELLDAYKENKAVNGTRKDFLEKAANIPGIYAPLFYDVEYNPDGTIRSRSKNNPAVPETIIKQVVLEMDDTYYPEKPIVPHIKVTQDRAVLEVQRGCIRGCRFCQAGMVYRPVRERSLEFLRERAKTLIENTGHDEISLISLSTSDYPYLGELVNFLIEELGSNGVNISLPSLRIDSFSLDVMSKVQDVKKTSLTFAPEAGTQRLRDVINKGLTEEDILNGSALAFEGGWDRVKLYFMLGLPTETEEDIKGIADICNAIANKFYGIPKEQRSNRLQITASTSFFVPKPFTPFQWSKMLPLKEYMDRARTVNHAIKGSHNKKSIKYNWHDADVTILEGLFARGDRRVGKAILAAYKKGCIFDAWTENFSFRKWMEACEETGVDIDFYTVRGMETTEILPWDFINTGVTKNFLLREYNNAMNAMVTPNCREKCEGCGAAAFGGGVCHENKS